MAATLALAATLAASLLTASALLRAMLLFLALLVLGVLLATLLAHVLATLLTTLILITHSTLANDFDLPSVSALAAGAYRDKLIRVSVSTDVQVQLALGGQLATEASVGGDSTWRTTCCL